MSFSGSTRLSLRPRSLTLNFYAVFETAPDIYGWKIVAKWSCLTGEIVWIVLKSEVMGWVPGPQPLFA